MESHRFGRVVYDGTWNIWHNTTFINFYSESECSMVRGVWRCQWLTNGEARWAYKNYALKKVKVKFLKPERNIPFKKDLWFYSGILNELQVMGVMSLPLHSLTQRGKLGQLIGRKLNLQRTEVILQMASSLHTGNR